LSANGDKCSQWFNSLLVFTGSGDNNIKAFESKSGICKRTFSGHTGAVNCILVSLIFALPYLMQYGMWNFK